KGFVTTFNYSKGIQDSAVRAEVCDIIEVNTYHSHPSTGLVNKNTYVPQKSAVVNDVPHFRMAAGCRQAGRPLLITEQNHCFWNRYLYENGIAFSSYSALQNFSGIMVHCIPVSMNFPVERRSEDGKLHLSKLQPFTVTQNPLFRANEFMAACLYLRGDVRPSPHRIDLSISNKYLLQTGKNVAPNTEQVKLALLCGFALDFPDVKRIPALSKMTPASMTIYPAAGASIRTEEWFTEIYDNKTGGFRLDQMVERLKRKGILPQDNKTDSDAGIFHSDTGEILLHSKAGMMSVTTPKSEGANLFAGNTCTLSVLDIKSTDRDAAVFVTSMDKNDLSKSSKVVLIYSTEEMNTGMKLSPDRTTCLEPGRHPCLLLTGKLEVELALKPAKWSLYALSVNGIRRENLPLSYKDGKIRIALDTAGLKNGVTPFFELAAE
ncbi:MAG: hypothetical protein JXR78_04030, partial [Victivallales bacterium]|nr:hypothetical protein [Victivallales bacterium]